MLPTALPRCFLDFPERPHYAESFSFFFFFSSSAPFVSGRVLEQMVRARARPLTKRTGADEETFECRRKRIKKNNELGLGERKPWTAEGQGVLIEQGTALLARLRITKHRKAQIVRGNEERHHNEDLPRADGFLAKKDTQRS